MRTCPSCWSADLCGHEVRGVYDGVLYWSCLTCGHAWPRDWPESDHRLRIAEDYVGVHNRATARHHRSNV